ncbi:MAG TPA: polyhydroxyalkanoate synthesis regulator DNA-binding domain-containing protein [Thermoanaerobaculia bacterium]|nr:polyhydroxyalkanoate synthesis regulator DNA-binding domain-containing protein [Thermoanaerobaculia bacterium]
MIRLIKRYESRKLYDTEESRYVSLEEIAGWVRQGQEVRVLDNATAGDVTSQTLTQIILDEGRRGTSSLPSELLHELVRLGERAVHNGVEQVQHGVDRLVQASIDRLGPVRRAREEMSGLRSRLEQLEESLAALDSEVMVGLAEPPAPEAPGAGPVAAHRASVATAANAANAADHANAAAANAASPANTADAAAAAEEPHAGSSSSAG